MKHTTYIWDMDGTLINSYPAIIKEVMETLEFFKIQRNEQECHKYILRYSVKELMQKIAQEEGVTFEKLYGKFHELQTAETMPIEAMPQARETLRRIVENGGRNLIFTHRGKSTKRLLETCGLMEYVEEYLSVGGDIPRKPAPGGILYLLNKHGLTKEESCYVGDRMLDMESAKNAGVTSILYDPFDVYANTQTEPGDFTTLVDVRVANLWDIP